MSLSDFMSGSGCESGSESGVDQQVGGSAVMSGRGVWNMRGYM